ncbi:NADH:flavin oxidoreductase / NADH oxidase family protein [Hirsutella rhossiliensis]|uniref:NADH:flavin oxidoreductase / NADH oxidase family domain-containing protein n=1 Tax=Hirsutella rhossiliensis TaxID=111463 RepID=A0A9P8MQ91_9HYPO|nr:NADH:flavin oxidoreductase / NADH oxidase family domain-containing protein [Hirsutella rhossiliensis]KAH0959305.1 NADH:flavin oxidoreductase / NADH oxidase family domain-containing protein [Hirsutella rhossiliensis]
MAPKRFAAEKADPSPLAQPLKFDISGKTAKNRFMKAAMTERLSSWDPKVLEKRGVPSKELVNVYRRWGEGGYGVILTGNVMIEYDQLEAAGNAIVPRDAPFSGERFDAFKDLATAAKKHGSLMVAQVSHPGRQVTDRIQKNPISASDVRLEKEMMGMQFAKPRPMEKKDFENVIEGFAHAAEYLHKAGFDGVELHAAHVRSGYLLSQFLSPTTNKRTDQYGGSVLNRSRIIIEIIKAIRERVADKSFIVGIKVNSVEFQSGGFTPEDCKTLCAELEKNEFDFVELSGGTYQEFVMKHQRESTRKREAFFLEFADIVIPELKKTKAYVTGGFRTTKGMKLLDSKVDSAIETLFDEENFGMMAVVAGTQIRAVGQGREPLDFSREDHKKIFEASMQKWGQTMAADKEGSRYGYVDIEGLKLEPFGVPYAAASL